MARSVAEDLGRISDLRLVMMRPVASSFAELPGDSVATTQETEESTFRRLAAESDWTLVIAPELDHELSHRVRTVLAAGGRLLGPDIETIAWTSHKNQTATHLARFGIPCPPGCSLTGPRQTLQSLAAPLVIKRVDGAGSLGLQRLNSHRELPPPARFGGVIAAAMGDELPSQSCRTFEPHISLRVESFCDGQPASVAILRGSRDFTLLQPCWQRIADDNTFRYLGGTVMSDGPLADRARRLATDVANALAPAIGYFGIDVVLGPCEDGSKDRVIEINPRITTSYVGLRAATDANLAELMLRLASGGHLPHSDSARPVFRRTPMHFYPDGRIETL